MRALAAYILRSRWHAIAVTGGLGLVTVFVPLPPVMYLGGAALGLCVFRHGLQAGLGVMAGATLVLALLSTLLWQSPVVALAMLVCFWLPALVLAGVHAATADPGRMILAAFVLVVALLAAVHLGQVDLGAAWIEWLNAMQAMMPPDLGLKFDQEVVRAWAWWLTGMLAAVMAVGMVVTVLIARWWQSLLYRPGGFGEEFRALRLPPRMALLTLVAAVFAVLQWSAGAPGLATEALMVAVSLYMFQGLAVMHAQVASGRLAAFWLIVVYVAMVILQQRAILALGFLGMVDMLLNFRRVRRPDGE